MSRSVGAATLALAAGVFLGFKLISSHEASIDYGLASMVGCVVLVVLCAAGWLVLNPSKPSSPIRSWLTLGVVVLFFLVLGITRYAIYAERHHTNWPDAEVCVKGVVVSPPATNGRRATVLLQTPPPRSRLLQINIWCTADSLTSHPHLGDNVTARGKFTRPRNFGNPDEFDYATWLWCQGICGTANLSASDVQWHTPAATEAVALPWLAQLRLRALQLRETMLARYAETELEGETLAIISALTLADRSQLTAETRDLYAEAGASHLLALSGLHLGIIVSVLMTLIYSHLILSPLRTPLCVLTLLLTWGFALVAGLPSSLVRASLMVSVALCAAMLDRDGSPLNHLVLTIVVMLLSDPTSLFDVGTQLSVSAVAGIILFYRPVQHWAVEEWRYTIFWLSRHHLTGPLRLLHVSLAAQVFTLPLVAWHFGRIPLYGPLAGIVLVPLTSVIIYMALALLATGGALPWLSSALAWSVTRLVGLQMAVMQMVASLPGATVTDFWSQKASPQVVVYNNRRCPALHVIASPSQSWLLTPRPEDADEGLAYIARSFWMRRLTAPPAIVDGNVYAGRLTAVMLCQPIAPNPAAKASPIDILWICDAFRGHLADALPVLSPRLVVLDSSLPAFVRRRLAHEAATLRLPVYDVAEQGALRLSLEQRGS